MLHVHEWGDAARPALLYLHGSGDDGSQGAALGSLGFRVLAPDAPGHGLSPALPPHEYLPSRLAAVAADVLDRHGIPAAVLAGFSWGASIACHFAAARPERTLALVLLEGGHVDFADVPELGDERGLGELVADEGLAGALAWGLRREPAASTYSALRGAGVPMLLVTALRLEAATALRVDPLARLSAEVPQAEIRVVARGGHSLLDEDADALAGIVGDWLARTVHGAAQRGR